MQKDIVTVTDVEAARALRAANFLAYFLEPRSPSQVAKAAGVGANLVHHHAKRCVDLGLLFEVKRESGKVFYQLTGRNFQVPTHLLEHDETVGVSLRQLSSAFMQAYERSARLNTGTETEYHLHSFSNSDHPEESPYQPVVENPKSRPAHFQALTVRMSASSYRKLIQKFAQMLNETKRDVGEGEHCTVAVFGFEGLLEDIIDKTETESRQLSSFVPGISIAQH